MDASLSSDHAFDFFAAEPVLGLAEAPNNQNRWIEWDVPLGGKMDEPMENLIFDEAEELDEFMDDDEDVLDEDKADPSSSSYCGGAGTGDDITSSVGDGSARSGCDRWIKSAGTDPTKGTAWSRVVEPGVAD
nr:hypothetical protein [Tanacetum cinerariifolium]